MQHLNTLLQLDPTTIQARQIVHETDRNGKQGAKHSKTYNNNNIITFDTETTSLYWQGQKCSFVYISMLCINGHSYYTRDLTDIKTFLDLYDTPGTVNVIYVHNLAFDFAFLQNILEFDKVFARRAHRPIFARYRSWEFRCSYFLSQMSLKNVAKSYKLPSVKFVDGLDYGKIRHCETPLTDREMKYCEMDVLTLFDYIKYMLSEYNTYRDIPYTQTGFVRKYTLEFMKQNKVYYRFRNRVKQTLPDEHVWRILEKCFAGGYTHANYWAVAVGLHTHVKSYDFTSSYPAVMSRCKFPVGAWNKITTNFKKYIESDNYNCIGRFRLVDLESKTNLCYLSKHKCVKTRRAVINNGRVIRAKSIEIYLTDVDIKTVKMMYDCKIYCLEMYVSNSDYLPREFVLSILNLYENKTKYKGIDEQFSLYMASKQMVNSEYGMCAFNPYTDGVDYVESEWILHEPVWNDIIKYYNNRNTILPYAWGVFTTAWARNKLCNICSQIGNDVLYMDTDSIKFVGDYDALFRDDNAIIHAENIAAAERLDIPFDKFAPADTRGDRHEIGLWDFEYEYKSFKCLGAKRYCYTLYGSDAVKHGYKPDEIFPVVAGCPTHAMREWLKLHDCNAQLKPFRLDIHLDKCDSGKSTVTYHKCRQYVIPVRDYLGNVHREYIGFGAHIEPTTFDMSLHDDYFNFLCGFAVDDKSELTRNGVVI